MGSFAAIYVGHAAQALPPSRCRRLTQHTTTFRLYTIYRCLPFDFITIFDEHTSIVKPPFLTAVRTIVFTVNWVTEIGIATSSRSGTRTASLSLPLRWKHKQSALLSKYTVALQLSPLPLAISSIKCIFNSRSEQLRYVLSCYLVSRQWTFLRRKITA